ncbi:helix-turn-helix domain-containing protein [Nocardia sp. BMG51109]|uniref:helix-turn-helix domain-containing protein n=1 Tax=Nocardia sp. BMG51109 TaxID=1056816 RepID=UPI0004BCD3DB|nr:XRE family transcriptional regulator [Nocardia sp. BMG51109]
MPDGPGGADVAHGRENDENTKPALDRSRVVGLIGQRIRELRRGRLTLVQLAQAANVSVGLLSRLENGVGNPSFAALTAIARALDTGVHAFFETSAADAAVVKGTDRVTLRRGAADPELELLVPGFTGRIAGVLVTLAPGLGPDEPLTMSSGRRYEVVLEGSVRYRIEHEVHELDGGDFILFDAGRIHSRHNPSDSVTARILSFSTEAGIGTYFSPGG